MASFPLTNSYFSRWLLHHQPDNHHKLNSYPTTNQHMMWKITILKLTGSKRREFSGMIPVITSNNHPSNPQQPPATPSNPQQPIHSLLSTSKKKVLYPLVNKQFDPENHQFLMETSLPTLMTARVYVNIPEGNIGYNKLYHHINHYIVY